MGEDKLLYPKSKFLICITKLKKISVQLGENEPETFQYIVKDVKWETWRGKDFREAIYTDRENGVERKVEIVNKKPEKFIINQIYMLATRDKVWIWIEDEEEEK